MTCWVSSNDAALQCMMLYFIVPRLGTHDFPSPESALFLLVITAVSVLASPSSLTIHLFHVFQAATRAMPLKEHSSG
jgi:hypothetical protein